MWHDEDFVCYTLINNKYFLVLFCVVESPQLFDFFSAIPFSVVILYDNKNNFTNPITYNFFLGGGTPFQISIASIFGKSLR